MPTPTIDPSFQELLQKRLIATLATENEDGSSHLTAVWFLYEAGSAYIATSSRTRKYRNLAERAKASLMVDIRKPGAERGITLVGKAELISGQQSREINERLHRRYLSAEAIADPQIGPVFGGFDDVTVRLTPASWFTWDMGVLDAQAFGGKLGRTKGYMLPLD